MTFFSIPTISSASPARTTTGWSKLDEFTRTFAGADTFERQGDFLDGRMDEV